MKRGQSEGLPPEAIDDLIVAQSEHDSAWDKPVGVAAKRWRIVRVPQKLGARAAAIATRNHERSIDDWIRRIIRERIEAEEAEATNSPTTDAARYPTDKDKLPESIARILKRAEDLGVLDLAEQHDHYVYGTPKRRAPGSS